MFNLFEENDDQTTDDLPVSPCVSALPPLVKFDDSLLIDAYDRLVSVVRSRSRDLSAELGPRMEGDNEASDAFDIHVLDDVVEKLATLRDAVAFTLEFTRTFSEKDVEAFASSFEFNPDDWDFIHDAVHEFGLNSCLDRLAERLESEYDR